MKLKILKSSYFLIVLALLFSACNINSFDQNSTELTQEEALIAGLIIGESVSENQSGLLSSFQEAFAVPTQQNLIVGPSILSFDNLLDIQNYTYNFDALTGIHHVKYSRENQGTELTSTSPYEIRYTFWDADRNIITDPDRDRDRIEGVEYKAIRSGEIIDSTKVSYYTRTDHLFMNGISSENDMLIIDGYHSGEGVFTRIDSLGQEIKRDYTIEINYLDIQINKPIVTENKNFRTGVNGAFSYETIIQFSGNGNNGTKIVNGSIELNGDGTALLKFSDKSEPYRVRLENGGVIEKDEFEGRVVAVDDSKQSFTLSTGKVIRVNESTKISRRDFNSLDEVATALTTGNRIIAEGKYSQSEPGVNIWIATEVEFELESDEFSGLIASVNQNSKSFTLGNGTEFFVIQQSNVRYNGKVIKDFALLVVDLGAGKEIEAEGEFYVDVENGRRIVKKAEFEAKRSDDDDSDDEEDDSDDEEDDSDDEEDDNESDDETDDEENDESDEEEDGSEDDEGDDDSEDNDDETDDDENDESDEEDNDSDEEEDGSEDDEGDEDSEDNDDNESDDETDVEENDESDEEEDDSEEDEGDDDSEEDEGDDEESDDEEDNESDDETDSEEDEGDDESEDDAEETDDEENDESDEEDNDSEEDEGDEDSEDNDDETDDDENDESDEEENESEEDDGDNEN